MTRRFTPKLASSGAMRVAFLGLGDIGRPMARRLAASDAIQLTVWNRTRAVAEAFVREGGAMIAETPAAAAREATVVITCLSTSRDVESLLDGEHGLLAGLERDAVLVDCTSGDPALSRRMAERLRARGVHFIDAPVSGGVGGAARGTLTVMCGGDDATLARVRPVLETFGEKIVHCGPIGAGHAVKAVSNTLLAVHIWSTAEGLAALAKAGVQGSVALEVINASSGRSNASQNLFPERVLTRAFPRTFRLALLAKDTGIAAALARDERVPAPFLQLAAELFSAAHNTLGGEADHVEAVKIVEGWSGVELGR